MRYEPQTYGGKPYTIRIWQCADYGEHWHSNIEIYICLQGHFTMRVEGINYQLEKDDALFVASNESHGIFCDHPDTLALVIGFGYTLLGSDYSTMQDISFDHPFFNLKDDSVSEKILWPLSQIKEILLNPGREDIIKDWEFRSNLYAIAAYLATHKQTKKVSKERQARAKQLENMYSVLNYISEHFREQITVDYAATITGYDKSYFCKQFRKATGMTFHRYLNNYRISVACQYLADSNISISSVAERSGFTSQKMMSRLFRDILGITPTEYRKLSPEKKNTILPL